MIVPGRSSFADVLIFAAVLSSLSYQCLTCRKYRSQKAALATEFCDEPHDRSPPRQRRTRVEIEHRNLERHGQGWESERDGVAGDQGWPLYLQRYAALFAHKG